MSPNHKISLGSIVASLGAILLLVSLFLDWYGSDNGGGATGWETFEFVDVVLAALALVVLVDVGARVARGRWPQPPAGLVTAAGPVALLLVVLSLVNDPPLLLFAPDPEPEVGIWLALVAALLMTAGALLGRMRISIVLAAREPAADRARPADPAAETRTMPAEPPPP